MNVLRTDIEARIAKLKDEIDEKRREIAALEELKDIEVTGDQCRALRQLFS